MYCLICHINPCFNGTIAYTYSDLGMPETKAKKTSSEYQMKVSHKNALGKDVFHMRLQAVPTNTIKPIWEITEIFMLYAQCVFSLDNVGGNIYVKINVITVISLLLKCQPAEHSELRCYYWSSGTAETLVVL